MENPPALPRASSSAPVKGLVRPYLVLYNAALAAGWSAVLYHTASLALTSGPAGIYPGVYRLLQVVQTAAVMEIIHSLTGLVRSPVMTTFSQVFSRVFVVWGILHPCPQLHSHIAVLPLLLSWSLVEIIRYGFFAVKEATGNPPAALLWLRYSAFYVLYPSGILSEVSLIYSALPYLRASKAFSLTMPNRINFGFEYFIFVAIILLSYIPGGPYMYTHMMKQRRKALAPRDKSD